MAATTHREIRVDRTLCMGSGQCSWYAPNTFDQDDETIAIVIDPRLAAEGTVMTFEFDLAAPGPAERAALSPTW